MKRLLLLSTSLFVLHFISCNEGPTTPGESLLWPMAIGNKWIGIREYYDGNDNSLLKERDTLSIVGSLEIEGETWYEFNDGALRANRAGGVWSRMPGSTGNEFTYLFAQYPTARGDTFETTQFVRTFENGQQGPVVTSWIETLSVDSMLTIPMGHVRAHIYSTYVQVPPALHSGEDFDTWALAPGVGPLILMGSTHGRTGTGVPGGTAYYVWKLEEPKVR